MVTGLDLGAMSNSLMEEQLIINNPHLQKLLSKLVDERIQDAREMGELSNSQLVMSMSPKATANGNVKRTTSKKQTGMALVKSLSDTTIYAPALR